ncbi:DNA cytosine methyltransferase [bacterium]|nr:DNA cytosine methyltransferase [bacterium]
MKKQIKQQALFSEKKSADYFDALCESLKVELFSAWPDAFGDSLYQWASTSGNNPIRTLSLFSGLGGLDIAFHDAGFDVLTLLEIDARFAKTLEANVGAKQYLGDAEVLCMDVREFNPPDMHIDFIIGGPPCQSFSAAARRASGVTGINDHRGVLFREYARIIKALGPRGFLFENVAGITSANNGKAWIDIKNAFKEVGYNVYYRILDAADFGVPQHRERMFIVGVQNKAGKFLFPRPSHGPDSRANRPFYNAGIATRSTNDSNSMGEVDTVGGRYAGLLEQIPPGLNYSFFTEKMGHPNPVFSWRSKFSDFLYKADPETPTRTLKAQGGKYTGPFHWDNRPFSIAELKRIQTLPDRYKICGGKQVSIHQIGNSVPPQLGRILALSVLQQVFDISPPSPLDYLDIGESLGFRSRKRLLTSRYRDKATEAIKKNGNGSTVLAEDRKYNAFLSQSFDFSEVSESSEANLRINFSCSDSTWRIHASAKGVHPRKKTFEFRLKPSSNRDWSLPVSEVVISGNSFTQEAYTGGWKAFETELILQNIKADIVQLCGYYQYEPAMRLQCKMTWSEPPSEWGIVQLVSEGIGVRSTFKLKELAKAWNVPASSIISNCIFLKSLGFEVRNSATNPEIPSNAFLIPYAFPTLNPKSVQLRKHLLAAEN